MLPQRLQLDPIINVIWIILGFNASHRTARAHAPPRIPTLPAFLVWNLISMEKLPAQMYAGGSVLLLESWSIRIRERQPPGHMDFGRRAGCTLLADARQVIQGQPRRPHRPRRNASCPFIS
jgi:hypothetical protein